MMKKYILYSYRILVVSMLFLLSFGLDAQTTLAQWTFPVAGTTVTPDVYSVNNVNKTLTSTQSITSSAGNGTQAASATGWDGIEPEKYWMIEVNTQGFNNVKISSQQRSSGTGPRDFKLQYKIGSTSWTDVPSGSIVVADNFASGVVSGLPILSGSDIPSLFIRWIMTSNTSVNGSGVATSGTSRIDNIKVTGEIITNTKPEPTNFPANFTCGATTSASIPISWTDAAGSTVPDGYLIQWSPTSYSAITAPSDGTPVPDGASATNVGQGTQSFNATGLSANSTYFFKIWSYTNSGSNINYKLIGEPQTSCTTQGTVCNFTENFDNSNANSNYVNGNFTGNNGIIWNYTAARDENGDENNSGINGKALMLRRSSDNSKIVSSTINSGIANFTVKLYKGFTGGGNRQVELLIDGVTKGISPAFDDYLEHSFAVNNINIAGIFTIELRNITDKQIVVDDIQWTCYNGVGEANMNIQGNGVTILNGDITPSTTDGTDFGGAIFAGTDVEKTFTMQNLGSANLNLANPAVVLSDSTNGFSVSAQPTINPMLSSSNQTFKVKFNNSIPGTYINTVNIGSNDPDTPNYTFQIKATVAQPVITTDTNSLSGFTYALSQGPSATQDFMVNGTNLGTDIKVTASSNWEISTNLTYDGNNVSPWTTLILPRSSTGAVTNKKIHVRLKDGLAVGSYSGSVSLSSTGANTQYVLLSGEVTMGIRDIKVTGKGTSIANGSTVPSGLNNTLFATQNLGNSQTKTFEIKNIGGAPLTLGNISIYGADAAAFSILNGPPLGVVLNQYQTASFETKFAPTTIGTKNATVSISSNDPDDNPYIFAIRGGAVYCSSPGEIVLTQQGFELNPAPPVWNYTLTNFGTIAPGPNTGFSSGTSGSGSIPKDNNLYAEGLRGYRIQGADPVSEIPSGVTFTFDPVDTSVYTNISLSFKIAGFSLGSVGNGMDDLDAANVSTTIHANKLDYVLVEVSPDDGVTWYQQAKVVSGELNLPWSFGSANTTTGSRNYAANNNLTYFSSTAGNRYSGISIDNLPASKKLKVRISAQDNALNESWILDEIQIKSTGLVPKVWNGSAWIPSAPTNSDKAILNSDYNSATAGSFTTCQCEVNPGVTLTVGKDSEVKVSDFLVNNGSIRVVSEGNLIQVNETDTNSGIGTFKAEQKITLSAGRNQYNYIISPTEGFSMKDLYKNAVDQNSLPVAVPFVLYHNEGTNTFLNSTGAYIKGRGLAVKEPGLAFVPAEITGVFAGKPTNGAFNYTLVNSSPTNISRGYNLIGNPYPSNLDLIKFYQNNASSGTLSPTFYLWDSTANTRTAQEGDGYDGVAYAQFNAATPAGVGTPTKAQGDIGAAGWKIPTKFVSVAQGFMAKVINSASMNITFNNSIRSAGAASDFFGKLGTEDAQKGVNRFWLNLLNPHNIACNIAVVYSGEGVDGFTKEDSRSLGGSDVIYSIVEGEKISINGKSNFVNTDEVDLGTKHFTTGIYTIALDRTDGIFAKTQNIYLKDSQTNTIANLTEGNYSFFANEGETAGRFKIIYHPQTVLATDSAVQDDVRIYRIGNSFVVKSLQNITGLEMYDAVGRLIYKVHPNRTDVIIDAERFPNGLYILRIDRNGKLDSKKIRK